MGSMVKSALEKKKAGVGAGESRGRGRLPDEVRGRARGKTAEPLLCLFKEQRSVHCGWTLVVREGRVSEMKSQLALGQVM